MDFRYARLLIRLKNFNLRKKNKDMKKFDYKVEHIRAYQLSTTLDLMGSAGWELVTTSFEKKEDVELVTTHAEKKEDVEFATLIFKRER